MTYYGEPLLESPTEEIQMLRRLEGHPHVLRLLDFSESESAVWLVLELCDGGELFDMISRGGKLHETQCVHYMRQIVSAVAHCHARFIAHLDLSLENVLIDAANNIRLSDFGMARELKRVSVALQSAVSTPALHVEDHAEGDEIKSSTSASTSTSTSGSSSSSSTTIPITAALTTHPTSSLQSLHSSSSDQTSTCAVSHDLAIPNGRSEDARLSIAMETYPLSGRFGKVAYMSPEVYAGLPFDGRRADTFSLGVMLFLMLTGLPPWILPTNTGKRLSNAYNMCSRI
jgi:serine/threonine protein kinase